MIATAVLIALLGSQSFAVREAAHESLERFGSLAATPIWFAADSSDPEIASRACRLMGRLKIETDPTSLLLGSFVGLPYCDALPGFMDYVCEARNLLMEHGLPVDSPLWLHQRLATRLWLERHGPIDPTTLSLMAIRSKHWDARGCYPP